MSSRKTSSSRQRFFDAAEYGRLEEVSELSSKFCNDVKVLSQAMIRACVGGRLDVLKCLVGFIAADVNYNNGEEWWNTPLIAACENNHLDIVKYLMETCHADVNLSDSVGYTSLTKACRYVRISVSMYLMSEISDIDVNIADRFDGNTALHLAVWCSKNDYTELHEACFRGNVTKVLRLVYMRDHMINVQDNAGDTSLHRACCNGQSDIVEILILAGADEKITNDWGKTPAQVAEREGHRELLKLLCRESLWEVMTWRQKKLKQMTIRWRHILTVVHAVLKFRSINKSVQ